MESPTVELILIEIKLQVIADLKVGIKRIKCQKNQSESDSENVSVNDDHLGKYIVIITNISTF